MFFAEQFCLDENKIWAIWFAAGWLLLAAAAGWLLLLASAAGFFCWLLLLAASPACGFYSYF